MENLPIFYHSLKLVFSGFIIYAAIQSAFICLKIPAKETRALLVVSCISFLFIASDVLNSVFTFIIVRDKAATLFLIMRELLPMLFFCLVPYYLDHVLDLKPRVKKINRVFFLAGIAFVLAISALTAFSPDLLIQNAGPGHGLASGSATARIMGPLTIVRNALVFVYLIYSTIVVMTTALQRESLFPWKTILAGLVILSYFAFSNLFALLFSGNDVKVFNQHFPYLGLGFAVLVLFMGFGVIELFINSFGRLEGITKDLRSELYYDGELRIQNKIGFRRDLNIELDKYGNNGDGFSLFYFDIDNFQKINESYGESFGDEILKMLSGRLKENFPQAGTLYRIGGDEFSFLVKEIRTEEEAGDLASKIISSLKKPFKVSGISYTVTVSIAILFIPRDGSDIDNIMNNAYSTIRSVKRVKNSYGFFSRNLQEVDSNKIFTVDLLRNCLSRDEFTLYYQPAVDALGKLVYVEALLRCTNNHPAIGGPDHFIPIIQNAGLMKDLDNLVVRKSFYDIEMKIKQRLNVSINMSASQLVDPSYVDFLSSFAKQHGIEPGRLILEITENILVENILLGRKSLEELKKNGFMIAIDDFGKGFSSLTYLAELPVDIIKIDKAFVDAVPGDAKKETMAKYIIDLGHSMNLKVVAEGFESLEQVDFFKGLGCNYFQGYYFSRPLPLQELLTKYFPA